MSFDYELVVIGSGPAGQKAAIQAAKLRKKVALVERRTVVGGNCVNVGTIPSKTIREAIVYLTGIGQRAIYGEDYRLKDEISISDLAARTRYVVERERKVIRDQLLRNHVALLDGSASFVDEHTVAVDGKQVSAEKFVIATGSQPAHMDGIEFNGRTILDSDDVVLRLDRIPSTLLIVGAGVIGVEFASMFAALGTKVTIVDGRREMLEFCDEEIVEALRYHLRDLNVVFRLNEEVTGVDEHDGGTLTHLKSGKRIPADTVLYSAGRQGATDALTLENVGIEADARGRISVDEHYRTSVDHIYAVGDVIGFPSLAATSMEQGRLAAAHACGIEAKPISAALPIGIYTIPEISFIGSTEEQLTQEQTPYEVGVSRYRELARGAILGDAYGLLKLLVSAEDRRLLGVHVFGTTATELVHIGQTVMGFDGTVDYLVQAVFNYPTLAESYKVAALDATNKLRAISTLTAT